MEIKYKSKTINLRIILPIFFLIGLIFTRQPSLLLILLGIDYVFDGVFGDMVRKNGN